MFYSYESVFIVPVNIIAFPENNLKFSLTAAGESTITLTFLPSFLQSPEGFLTVKHNGHLPKDLTLSDSITGRGNSKSMLAESSQSICLLNFASIAFCCHIYIFL